MGFRYTAQNIALRYNVLGYVRNLDDGRVELVVEGEEREIDGLLQCLRQKMNGYISQIETQSHPATGEFDSFGIRHS